MITKQQWLEAIKQTRELWKGAHRTTGKMYALENKNLQELGNTLTCPFCKLVKEICKLCIAKDNLPTPHACSSYLQQARLSDNPEKRANKILDHIESMLDEIMEEIENE